MVRSISGRTLLIACALTIGRADAQEGTVPVTIRSASTKTELKVGAYAGGEDFVGCRLLCTTPCTLQLPPGTAQLCTAQSDVVPHHSADVNVPLTGAEVWLRAFPGKTYVTGFLLWFSGSLVAAVGTGVLGAWGAGFSPGKTSMVVGSVGVGLGGALLAAGIPVAVVYGREGVASVKPRAQFSLGPAGLSGTF